MRYLTYLITISLLIISSQVYSQSTCDVGFVDSDITDASFCGAADGAIDITVTSGAAPFEFLWLGDNGYAALTEDISGLAAGEYVVRVTDANGMFCFQPFNVEDGNTISCSGEISHAVCNGFAGAIDLTCSGGMPPYTYQWHNGVITEDQSQLAAGPYFVTITDDNGCTIEEDFTVFPTGCDTENIDTVNVDIVQITGGSQIQVDFVVTNFDSMRTLQYDMLYDPAVLQYDSLGNFSSAMEVDNNNFNEVELGVIRISWIAINNFSSGVTLPDGGVMYSLFFTPMLPIETEIAVNNNGTIEASNAEGFEVQLEFSNSTILAEGNVLSGNIYYDENNNCQNDGEQGLPFWHVKITNGTIVRNMITNSQGMYSAVLEDGTYDVIVTPIGENWNLCNNNITIDFNGNVAQDFGAVSLFDCPALEVDMAIPRIIRCFQNKIHISACNLGSSVANDAYLEVELDPELLYVGSEITPTNIDGNLLTFDLGDFEIGQCEIFKISVLNDCDNSVLGQTHCTTATIFPNVPCVPADPLWDGSSLEVTGSCDGGNVVFVIENVGTESMTQASSFIVIEDHVMGQSIPEDFMLAAGETVTITEPANGSTYYMSVAQVPNHPGNSNPSIAIEGCGRNSNGEFSLGVVTQFNQNDDNGFVDIECVENVGAYDPNDKAAMLKGFGAENYIYANTPMEYMIRFQNTGTFTAFNVVVEDVLSPNFDITSLRPGASSHDYTLSIEDERKLVFTFENINLPDSTADLAGSNGFITYKVNQLLDLEDGTVLENTADIFFDFNEAIVTNTTSHTIGSDFISFSTFVDNELGQENSISIFPNPATEKITFELEKLAENLELEVYDLAGRLIYNNEFANEKIVLSKSDLEEGMYFYSILSEGKQVESGKFIFL